MWDYFDVNRNVNVQPSNILFRGDAMRRYIVLFICCTLLLTAPLCAESLSDMPQMRDYAEAKSLSYLQRAYFSLEQALFYTEKSRSAKSLASFDYGKLLNDLELIQKDLHAYLYPRNEKITGDFIPFKIEGDYFLEDIIDSK